MNKNGNDVVGLPSTALFGESETDVLQEETYTMGMFNIGWLTHVFLKVLLTDGLSVLSLHFSDAFSFIKNNCGNEPLVLNSICLTQL